MFQSQTRCQAPFGLRHQLVRHCGIRSFNLRRDARPLSAYRCKPFHLTNTLFQSQTRCQAPFGCEWLGAPVHESWFQSQTRCQAPFGVILELVTVHHYRVSISDEMPGPFRLRQDETARAQGAEFQSQTRCQAPFGPANPFREMAPEQRFNLRRDARPLSA